MSDNATAIAAAGGAALSLVGLFSVRILRVFNASVLGLLKQYSLSPVAGTPFVFEGKTNAEITRAVIRGSLSKSEALVHFASQIDVVSELDDEAVRSSRMASLETQLKLLQAVDDRAAASSSAVALAGVYHFVWGKCTEVVVGASSKVTIGTEKDRDKGALVASTRILTPRSSVEFFEILDLWQAMVVQVGLAPLMVVFELVQHSVWLPMRNSKMPWVVAHELLLVYLSRVDQSKDRALRLSNVYDKVGVDAVRSEAVTMALERFGASFQSDIFRFSGGTRAPGGDDGKGTAIKWNGKDSPNSTRPCEAYNRGNEHLIKHLHPDGTCKFKHGCSKWVKDSAGVVCFCLRNHRIGKCDRDASELSKTAPN